jgi:hypothetical protein
MEQEIIFNRFERVFDEWVCLHDEDVYFRGYNPSLPAIFLCGRSLRVRANDAWSKLPKHLKNATVAHEIGHREMGHASVPQDNPFYRTGFILRGTVNPRELEADRFACKLVGRDNFIKALRELREMMAINPSTPNSTLRELKLRAEALVRLN